MRWEFGERRGILKGRHHWRFLRVADASEAMRRLEHFFRKARCRCSNEENKLIAVARLMRYEVEREGDDTISICAEYGALFLMFPKIIVLLSIVVGAVVAIWRKDAAFLLLGLLGLGVGATSYFLDMLFVPLRQRRVLEKIIEATDPKRRKRRR